MTDGPGAANAGPPGGWLAHRTLRGRLIVGLLALLALACALVGLTTYFVLRNGMYNQLGQQVDAASQRFIACVEHKPGGVRQSADHDKDNPLPEPGGPPQVPGCGLQISGQAAGTFTARLEGGRVRNCFVTLGSCRGFSRENGAVLAAMPSNGTLVSRELSSIDNSYLLTAKRQDDGDVLVTGLPLSSVNSTLQRVAITEIAVFGLALLLLGVAGTAWVRLSLRPLGRVTATARAVTRQPLASGEVDLPLRVPDEDPRTEVGQLGAAFNRMLGHVEAALARRHASEDRLRRFAADASHELRTPLAAIRGYAQLARREAAGLPGLPDGELKRALERIDSESARMTGLVDDLLLLARLDAGRPLESKPVDLSVLAIDVTSDARVAAPDHRWLLDLPEEPVVVPGDEARLHQVLANLLSNAARHTPKGTTVTVSLAEFPVPAVAELSVTDDGPGIPADLQPDLFERFVRGDPGRSRAAGSTGLGLAIVDAVTAAHGGRVSVTSGPGHTRFTVTLPHPEGLEAAAAAGKDDDQDGQMSEEG